MLKDASIDTAHNVWAANDWNAAAADSVRLTSVCGGGSGNTVIFGRSGAAAPHWEWRARDSFQRADVSPVMDHRLVRRSGLSEPAGRPEASGLARIDAFDPERKSSSTNSVAAEWDHPVHCARNLLIASAPCFGRQLSRRIPIRYRLCVAVPGIKTIDTGTANSPLHALIVDLGLMSLFAVQHSGMARQGFKKLFASFASTALERSTYVLLASLTLLLLFWQWQPITTVVWQIKTPTLVSVAMAGGFLGWLIVLYSTSLINHFELFGLTQVVTHFTGRLARADQV
jgi:protein-S-isoprenylcysteine O-methyltransferase Ste14